MQRSNTLTLDCHLGWDVVAIHGFRVIDILLYFCIFAMVRDVIGLNNSPSCVFAWFRYMAELCKEREGFELVVEVSATENLKKTGPFISAYTKAKIIFMFLNMNK